MRAARIFSPRLRGCSLLRSIAQNDTRQLCSKTALRSPEISFAPCSLKFKRGSNSWRCTYMTCLLAFRNILQMNDLRCRLTLEGTRASVWICAWPRLVESGIGAEQEQNGTITLAFGLKPALRSHYISHAPLPACAALRSAHMPWLTSTNTYGYTIAICNLFG